MEFLTFLILVVLFIRWLMIRSRFQDLEEKLRELQVNGDSAEQIGRLTARVFQLEQALQKGVVPAAPLAEALPVKAEPMLEPVAAIQPVEPPPLPVMVEAPPLLVGPPPLPMAMEQIEPAPEPELAPPPPPKVFAPPEPSFAEQMRNRMSGQEWEALVGGNILNKIGALLVVIGLGFFLGLGFTRVGPAGRAAIGACVSLGLLAAGLFVERKELYKVFARGLIGAGWASLYFTAYAMYAVDATRVIENPVAGTILLLTVAAAMIGHTLKYGSQGATGVAYFTAFAALALSPSTPLAAIALLPLALSLLYLAHKFSWYPMALFGLLATYGTLISRGDSGSPLASTQALLFFYWVLFEGFDLMRVARRVTNGFAVAIFPLNSAAFLVLSLVKWSKSAPNDDYLFGMASAALYLASAVIRWRLHPPRTEDGESLAVTTRLSAGGYEAPAIISSIMAALSIFSKVHGVWAGAALAVEAEILFLAGMSLRERLLERLGLAGFFFSLTSLAGDRGKTQMFGRQIHNSSPAVLLHVAIFYANRAMRAPGRLFSYSASILTAIVLTAECPERFLGTALVAFGLILLEFGLRRQLPEFRYQGYGAMFFGIAAKCAFNGVPNSREGWIQVSIGIAIAYFMSMRKLDVPQTESKYLRWGAAISTSLLAVILAAKLVPTGYLGLTWALIAVALLELGLHELPSQLRWPAWAVAALSIIGVVLGEFQSFDKFAIREVWISYAVGGAALYWFAFRNQARFQAAAIGSAMAMTSIWVVMPDVLVAPAWAVLALCLIETGLDWHGNIAFVAVFGRLFLANFTTTGYTGVISHRVLTVVPIVLAHYHVWYRNREREGSAFWTRLHLWAPAILAFVLLRFELGHVYTVAGWALLGLALLYIGLRGELEDMKRQSYGIAALTFLRCLASNFFMPESLGGLAARLGIAACVIGAFYASQLLIPRGTKPRTFFSLLATALLTSVIFHEVSGSMLTVAWGIEGILLLICGFPLRERVLRLAGLALLLFCILKLFFFDLRTLETMARILSFIVLGVILMSVSWIYTRFRDRIRQYL